MATTDSQRRCPKWRDHPECFYCEEPLGGKHEHDHAPVPKRCGGKKVWCVCRLCHTLKDRVPLDKWRVLDYGIPQSVRLSEKADRRELAVLEKLGGFVVASKRSQTFPTREALEAALPRVMTLFDKAASDERILLMKVVATVSDLVAKGERMHGLSGARDSHRGPTWPVVPDRDAFDLRSLR